MRILPRIRNGGAGVRSARGVQLVAVRGLVVAVAAAVGAAGLGQGAAVAVTGPTGSPTGGAVEFVLTGHGLTVQDAFEVLDAPSVHISLAPSAVDAMTRSRDGALAALREGARVYGWNQALGPLKDHPLSHEDQLKFQENMLLSHAAGVGPAVPDRVARLALVLKANQMAAGDMGVRPDVPQRLLTLVNAGVTPVMPQIGSLGTGDLQPQAAAGLVATGGQAPARYDGRTGPASQILPMAGIDQPFAFQQGEALPMISGSTVMTAMFLATLQRAAALTDLTEGAFALFMEATRAEASSLDLRTHAARGIPAEMTVVRQLRAIVDGSQWMTDEGRAQLDRALGKEPHPRVQDAVSVRAAPHVIATVRQDLAEDYVIAAREENASTSNPLIFPKASGDGWEFVMGGNWDGAMIGHAADTLNADMVMLGQLSQTLSARLLSPGWSYGLPANLAGGKVGLNSGMVQVQSVAVALIPEMQTAVAPSAVLNVPAKDGQEDLNTMAMASVRNLAANQGRLATILAIQYLMDSQAIDLIQPKMAPLVLGNGSQLLQHTIRAHIPALVDDRWMMPDEQEAIQLINNGTLLTAVRDAESR